MSKHIQINDGLWLVKSEFTNQNYGLVEDQIKAAAFDESARFLQGKKKNCLPKADAYCLMDLFADLAAGDNTFHPRSKSFVYKRIGRKAILKEGIEYPEFNAKPDQGYSFDDNFTWNRNRANLSVRIREEGELDFASVTINEGINVPTKLNSFRYRNFAIVADGDYRVPTLPVKLDKDTFEKLKTTPLIHGNVKYAPGRIYDLRISSIPIINRNMAKQEYVTTEFFGLLHQELEYKAALKVYKYYLNNLKTDGDKLAKGLVSVFGTDGAAFLKERGVTDNGFSPQVTKAAVTDYYMANYFSAKVKGVSSLPKVTDVENKMELVKPLTVSQTLLRPYIEKAKEKEKGGPKTFKTWLESEISTLKLEKFKVAAKIQKVIFTITIGNVWFSDLETREPEPMEHNGFTYTLKLEQKKVEI